MESFAEAKKLISEAKDVCVIPSETSKSESAPIALALFYTLKELGKNVNLIIGGFPEGLDFLIPSPDFISQPKNLVISIPRKLADVSQIYYEKNEENTEIHLTIDKGNIKKDNVSFYFKETKPDLVIALNIKDFQKHLGDRLDSFGYLLGSPILNMDSALFSVTGESENKKFGAINLIESRSLPEMALDLIMSLGNNSIKKEVASCLLAAMVACYENFKNPKTTSGALKTAAYLMESGADYNKIVESAQNTAPQTADFLSEAFRNMREENGTIISAMETDKFWNFRIGEAKEAAEKINGLGIQSDLLVLWKSHASEPAINGLFCSKKSFLLDKIARGMRNEYGNGWIFVSVPGSDINQIKEQILKLII